MAMKWTALLFLPLLLARPAAPQQPNQYVGNDVCKTCHADVWMNFYKNPHGRPAATDPLALTKEAPSAIGCEGCHGPGGAHVAASGGKATIKAFSNLGPAETLDTCLGCHSKDVSKSNIRRSQHTEANVVCTNCHSIHKAQAPKFLLAKNQTELCYSCHTAERAAFQMPSKHRVNEGVIKCTDCHNPHGTPARTNRMGGNSAMLQPAFDNEEPCLKCHVDKRGPFVFEHASVRVEGCQACHVPHGSMNSRLMRRPVMFTMCLECHNGADKFGRENAGVFKLDRTHNLLDPKYQQCTLCHVRIHGSNSDATFLR
jgi:DmsE family decaheme c-type cytochrome